MVTSVRNAGSNRLLLPFSHRPGVALAHYQSPSLTSVADNRPGRSCQESPIRLAVDLLLNLLSLCIRLRPVFAV